MLESLCLVYVTQIDICGTQTTGVEIQSVLWSMQVTSSDEGDK